MSHGGYRRQALQLSFTALHQPCADESFVSRFTQQKLVALGDVEGHESARLYAMRRLTFRFAEILVVFFPFFGPPLLFPCPSPLQKTWPKLSFMSTPRNIRRHAKYPPSLENLISLVEFPMPSLDNELLSGSAEAAWTFRLRKFGEIARKRNQITDGSWIEIFRLLGEQKAKSGPLNATALVEKGLAVEIERTEDGSFSRDRRPRQALVSKEEEKPRVRAKEADAIFGDHKLHQNSYIGIK
ncbi:hypothetical protein NC653_032840 [Populus alba x Populus x berolinensis]|uniref:Uncharacterized protein n=1 Tax=Populus alba x Populus x berolinensis TaxID=444605 RepID=A0AAD6PYK9_9ROSI|nr:hypothetical protein NC653_032840 [Populus alba x Populus x berolinensis]